MSKKYKLYVCTCGCKRLRLTNGPWLDPMITCKKCGAWALGDTQQDVVNRWNKSVLMTLEQRKTKMQLNIA